MSLYKLIPIAIITALIYQFGYLFGVTDASKIIDKQFSCVSRAK